jgi:hypothetical protein
MFWINNDFSDGTTPISNDSGKVYEQVRFGVSWISREPNGIDPSSIAAISSCSAQPYIMPKPPWPQSESGRAGSLQEGIRI